MKILSNSSYHGLIEKARAYEAENAELKAKLGRARARYQQLVLRVGIVGFDVELKPEVPAQPARLVLKKAK